MKLKGLTLSLRQRRENLICDLMCLLRLRAPRRPQTSLFVRCAQFNLVVEAPHQQIIPPIDTPTLCTLQEPYFEIPSRRVVLSHAAIDFKKYGLGEIFRLTGIA